MKLAIAVFLIFVSLLNLKSEQSQISLNGNWRFALAKNDNEAIQLSNFYLPQFIDSAFHTIPVPSNWAVLGYEEPIYKGFKDSEAAEGFYLYNFSVSKTLLDKRVLLHFGGVWSEAEVWLNGKSLGLHNGGYTSFAFNVEDKLKEHNQLAVRVKQVCKDYTFDVYDDWTLGGIYRDVTLEAMPQKRWLDHLNVQTSFDHNFTDADMVVRVMVSDLNKSKLPGNYPLPGESYELRLTLTDKEGHKIAEDKISVPGHTSTDREVPFNVRVKAPHQWTAETPYLYQLSIELLEKGIITHSLNQQVGFRQISTARGVFRINGQAVKLRGVNRHDEHPDVGRATTREHWLQDISLMKAANINYIRMCHYAPAKGFVEMCDSMGMYVGEEISLGGAGDLMYDPSLSGAVLQRSYETVTRDINNPSIVYWSVGNEDPLTSLHLAAIKLIKGIDSTRPVLIPWRAESWLPEDIDILAPHYWKPQEYDRLAGVSTRPIISTEYTHAYGNEGAGGLEACWKALTKYPAGAGAAVWMWADQGIRTPKIKEKKDMAKDDDYLRLVQEGWDGIVDSYRHPTRDYWEVKSVYAQVYPATDKVNFKIGENSVNIPIQNDYDFTNLETVKIKWSIKEDEKEISSGTAMLKGQPHSVSMLSLPLDQLKNIRPDKTYYIWLTFENAIGAEITRKSVELEPATKSHFPVLTTNPIITNQQETTFSVKVGDVNYLFNPRSGQLISANLKEKPVITGLRPIIWHNPDMCEVMIPGGKQVRNAGYLTKFTPMMKSWKVEELSTSVIIRAKVDYAINEKNNFNVNYCYTIYSDGKMSVSYEIRTKVDIPWLPVVGLVVQSVPEVNEIRWLGAGPYDAWSNKKSAAILGVWGGTAGSPDVLGNKIIRWVERNGTDRGFRISGNNYMAHEALSPNEIGILSEVLGRPEKGRKADDSNPQLITNTKNPFVGGFEISLH